MKAADNLDVVDWGRKLVERINELSKDLVPRVEVDRAKKLLADLGQQAASAREEWRVASADLTQVLRLDPRWYPRCKGIGNFQHYQSQALACNPRYLEALAAVQDPTPTYADLRTLTERERHKGRSYAGFHPAREEEARLFAAVRAGDHLAQGFRNKDIRAALMADPTQAGARLSAAVARLLKRLQVRGLVAKVPRTRRWRVTEKGQRILGDTLRVYRRYAPKAA